MSEPKSNYHYHKEKGSQYFRDHIRAFEAAKMQRIVEMNASTGAGAAIRRKPASAQSPRQDNVDSSPLIPRKAHWTTEERWQKASEDKDQMEESEKSDDESIAPDAVGKGKGLAVREAEVPAMDKNKEQGKDNFRRRASDLVMTAATGFVPKPDSEAPPETADNGRSDPQAHLGKEGVNLTGSAEVEAPITHAAEKKKEDGFWKKAEGFVYYAATGGVNKPDRYGLYPI